MEKNNKNNKDQGETLNKSMGDDLIEIIIQFVMPFVAKIFLNVIPRDKWQSVVSDQKKLWEAATVAIPFAIRRLTKFKPVYDQMMTDFFQEVNQEIVRRESGELTSKTEREIRASLLDILSNEADKNVILDNYVDVFSLATTHHQHHNLIEFINSLRPEALLSLLRMDKPHRDKFILLIIGAPGKEQSSLAAIMENLTKIGSSLKSLDDKLAPGTALDTKINNFFNDVIKPKPREKKGFVEKIGHFVNTKVLKLF
ncbi:MAG: hypothetical protein NTY12_03950 [Candidatus Falkowbacteria bacterium]|nr:hypothetical protein [Candidatus Falkowbacteria bacterium]